MSVVPARTSIAPNKCCVAHVTKRVCNKDRGTMTRRYRFVNPRNNIFSWAAAKTGLTVRI